MLVFVPQTQAGNFHVGNGRAFEDWCLLIIPTAGVDISPRTGVWISHVPLLALDQHTRPKVSKTRRKHAAINRADSGSLSPIYVDSLSLVNFAVGFG